MRYQIVGHGWPIGDRLVPGGTVIDAASPDDWSRLAAGRVPPINTQALDKEAYDLLLATYYDQTFRLMPKGF
jgi:hypothetical protein